MGTKRTPAAGIALLAAVAAATSLAAPPTTAVQTVPRTAPPTALDTAKVSRPKAVMETATPSVSFLTPGECTQHNGSVVVDSFGVCPMGLYCTREDNKGVTHRVCIDRL